MSILTCPNCKSRLTLAGKSYKCENGHAFDIAKEGYVNLLLPNKKKTLNPGDNKTMLRARENFLSTGAFQFLIDGINSQLKTLTSQLQDIKILDIGSGSGFYLRKIFDNIDAHKIGLDISKNGMSIAAKQDKKSTYLVASAYDLPIASDSIDVVINIFSPIDLEELSRVLKSTGYFLKVVPGSNHMKEVAELVYENFEPHQSDIDARLTALDAYTHIEKTQLEDKINLSKEELKNLISMTPYLYKFSEEQINNLTGLAVTLSFDVLIYQYA